MIDQYNSSVAIDSRTYNDHNISTSRKTPRTTAGHKKRNKSTMVESKKGKAVQSSNYTNQLLTLIKKIHSPKNDNAIN